ncbi:hypothetical protein CVM52_13525 [Pseudooceanicola lipolyticus]|uniref:Uncharacterized protein n=1 Tax=Pseudooceanicola lipolyticus TaxID=2029104 RepID=A0A2M8J086_9RHOB|nr:hypothetical protein [Pseudooceanicola lipolyticus]PJE36158.1 hypothetical protein CVM52_13525 [Pseudooceanicola lipolyticus]
MFDIMIWTGAALSLLGLAGLIWCILRVIRARRAGLSDEAMRAAVAAVLPINMGALAVSVIGLMLVVVGVILG